MLTVRTEYFLTIGEIAEEYKRNGRDVLPALLNAFWMGRFERFVRENGSPVPLISRRTLLEVWRDSGNHPGIHFSTSLEGKSEESPDGTIDVDLRRWIILPAQTAEWTSNNLQIAYGQLANVSITDISDECVAGLKCQFLGAWELLSVCYKLGTPPPPFWLNWDRGRRPSRDKESSHLETHALAALWLHRKLTGAQKSDVRREDVREEARSRGLNDATFEKLWKVLAPDNLREKGRRPGSKNRHPRS